MTKSLRIAANVLRLALGAALVVWILRGQDLSVVKPVLSEPWLVLGLVGLGFFGVGVEAIRLKLLLASQEVRLPFWLSYRIVMIGTFFNVCIPGGTGGDVMKLYYLASCNRGRGVEVAMILLVDRIVALFSLLFMMVAMALVEGRLLREYLLVGWMIGGAALLALAIVVGVVVSFSERVRGARVFNWLLDKLPLSAHLHRAVDAVHDFRDHKAALLIGVLVSLSGHAALAFIFIGVAGVILPGETGLRIAILSFLGILANVIPLTPGGLGVGEAAFDKLFKMAGYSGGAMLLVIWRLASLPLVVLGAVHYILGISEAVRAHAAPPAAPKARADSVGTRGEG